VRCGINALPISAAPPRAGSSTRLTARRGRRPPPRARRACRSHARRGQHVCNSVPSFPRGVQLRQPTLGQAYLSRRRVTGSAAGAPISDTSGADRRVGIRRAHAGRGGSVRERGFQAPASSSTSGWRGRRAVVTLVVGRSADRDVRVANLQVAIQRLAMTCSARQHRRARLRALRQLELMQDPRRAVGRSLTAIRKRRNRCSGAGEVDVRRPACAGRTDRLRRRAPGARRDV
jgi:hypothetical protein